jgi:hypothetical protein
MKKGILMKIDMDMENKEEWERLDARFGIDSEECRKKSELEELARQAQLKELIRTNRLMKDLQRNQLQLLSAISDKEKAGKMLSAVMTAHEGILEREGTLDDVLDMSFEDKELLKFLIKNKNDRFYKGTEVMDQFKDHPMQKKLVKNKLVGRRELKKKVTAHQHMDYMHKAKSSYSKAMSTEERMTAFEARIQALETNQTILLANQITLEDNHNDLDYKVDKLNELLSKLAGKIDKHGKIQAYFMSQEGVTKREICKTLFISKATAFAPVT